VFECIQHAVDPEQDEVDVDSHYQNEYNDLDKIDPSLILDENNASIECKYSCNYLDSFKLVVNQILVGLHSYL